MDYPPPTVLGPKASLPASQMDFIFKAKKVQSTNKYKIHQFFNNLILHSLTAFIFTLFCSHPFWFPQLCGYVNHFLFKSLPNFKSFFINPKFSFIVGNAIVIFLLGQSKFATSCFHGDSLSLEKGQGIEEASNQMVVKEEKEAAEEESGTKVIKDKHMVDEEKVDTHTDSDDKGHELGSDGGSHDDSVKKARQEEEDAGLPAEELKKRVEDFIARVNRQRWNEHRQVAYGRG